MNFFKERAKGKETEHFLYSAIYGSDIYQETGEYMQDPFGGTEEQGRVSPILCNISTGELFFARKCWCTDETKDYFRKKILRPPERSRILWPADMIHLDEDDLLGCKLEVEHEYGLREEKIHKANCALLFHCDDYPQVVSGEVKLRNIKDRSWHNPEIRTMAAELLRTVKSINENGYIYQDMHFSRIFFTQQGTAYLDFSNLVFSYDELGGEGVTNPQQGTYPIEFAEPAFVNGTQPIMDMASQNYSLAAMLFYLFFNRYPYDGRLLSGYVDGSTQQHYVKFRDYHKMPVFIFDPKDRENRMGIFEDQRRVAELWEELPEKLQKVFIKTLRRENAERLSVWANPTPEKWLCLMQEVGWLYGDGLEAVE